MTADDLDGFKTFESRDRFMKAYDATLGYWPPHELVDIDTEFGATRVTVSGPKSAQAMILLAGMTSAGAVSWFDSIAELSRSYRVFAIDTIGLAGRSVARRAPQSRDDYAAWLDEVITTLDLPPVVLVGHGHGGWISAYFACLHLELVRSLVLLDPADALVPVGKAKLLPAIIPLLFPTRENVRRILLGSNQRTAPRDLWAESVFLGMRYFRSAKRVLAKPLSDDELRSLTCPTLLLVGENSPYPAKKVVDRGKRLLPDVTAEIVPGSAHCLMSEDAEFVDRRIEIFLNSQIGTTQ